MAHTKLRLSLAIVVAMTVLAGCSSNKHSDSGSGANSGTDSTASGTFNGNSGANGSGSDFAESGRIVYFDFDKYALSAEGQAVVAWLNAGGKTDLLQNSAYNIKYIVLAKELDWRSYIGMGTNPQLQPIMETATLVVYKVIK